VAGIVVLGAAGGVMLAITVVVGVGIQPRVARARAARRRVAAIAATYPDFVDLVVLTIRSGCTPVQAVQTLAASTVGPIHDALQHVVARVRAGDRFADAIGELVTHLGPIARPLADGFALADRHGTPLGPMLDRLADESRAQRRRSTEAAARQLPVRLSFPLVGCTLPSFILLTIVPLMAGTLSSLSGIRP